MDSRLDLVHLGWLRRETLLARAALMWVGLLLLAHEVAFNRFLMARNGVLWPPWGEEVGEQDGKAPAPGWPSPLGYLIMGILLQIASYLGDYSGRLFYSAPLPVDEATWPSVTLYKFGAGAAVDPSGAPPAEYKPGDGLRLGDVGVHAGTLAELPGSHHFAFWGIRPWSSLCTWPVYEILDFMPSHFLYGSANPRARAHLHNRSLPACFGHLTIRPRPLLLTKEQGLYTLVQMSPKRKRYRSADASLTRAENKKKARIILDDRPRYNNGRTCWRP